MNIFKGLNWIKVQDQVDRVPEELRTEVHNVVQEEVTETIPKKKIQEAKVVVWGGFTNSWGKKRSEKQGRNGKITQLNAEFQLRTRRAKKSFLNEQCKEIEDQNRMGKIRHL